MTDSAATAATMPVADSAAAATMTTANCSAVAETMTAGNSAAAASAATLWQSLGDNQLTNGGLALMLAGVGLATVKSALELAIEHGKRRFLVRAEIDSRDDVYRWMMHWLAQHPDFRSMRSFSITTSLDGFGDCDAHSVAAPDAEGPGNKVVYLPAPGDHLLRYKGHWIWVSRQRQPSNSTSLFASARQVYETLRITAVSRSRKVVEDLVAEAGADYQAAMRQRTVVHSVDQDGYWTPVGSRPVRPLKSVVLPDNQARAVLEDCTEFLSSEQWYSHHGIPYRRGYLLYGPPGTGKTSLVTALAGELKLDVYVVTLSSPSMTDEKLRALLHSASPRTILLLEDVDAAFVGRGAKDGAAAKLTFSGLLNAIDGVAAQEGRLLFMTTNHLDRLSNALIRPGRVDLRVQFRLAAARQIRELFVSFYRDLPAFQTTTPQAPGVSLTSPALQPPGADLCGAAPALEGAAEAAANAPAKSVPTAEAAATAYSAPAAATAAASAASELSATTTETTAPEPAAAAPAATAVVRQKGLEDGVDMAGGVREGGLAGGEGGAPGELASSVSADKGGPSEGPVHDRLEELADLFAGGVAEESVSMAQLQGYLMGYKRDPEGAVRDVGAVSGAMRAEQLQEQQQKQELEGAKGGEGSAVEGESAGAENGARDGVDEKGASNGADKGGPDGAEKGVPNGVQKGMPNGIDKAVPNGVEKGVANGVEKCS